MAMTRLAMRALILCGAFLFACASQIKKVWQHDQQQSLSTGQKYRQILHNTEDVQYSMDFQVGNTQLHGILDTGSDEMLVFSSQCARCGSPGHLYDHRLSESYNAGMFVSTHSFGSGDAYSMEAFDDVQVGPLFSRGQRLWEVVDAAMPVLQSASFQAIVGIGPPSAVLDRAKKDATHAAASTEWFTSRNLEVPQRISNHSTQQIQIAYDAAKNPPLLQALAVRFFSVCLGKAKGSDGYFVWNDESPHGRPNVFTHVPVAGLYTWTVQLNEPRLRHSSGAQLDLGCTNGCAAVVDSGTSLLTVPPAVLNQIQAGIESLNSDCSNLDDMPTLHFNFGGTELFLPPDAYLGEIVGVVPQAIRRFMRHHTDVHVDVVHRCELLLMTNDVNTQLGPMWILGMPFFREFYTTFDVGSQSHVGGASNRSLSISTASDDCNPSGTSVSMLVEADGAAKRSPPAKRAVRRVNAAELRVPDWAAAAEANGNFEV